MQDLLRLQILLLFISGNTNPLLFCWLSHLQPAYGFISTSAPKSSPSSAQNHTKQEAFLGIKELEKALCKIWLWKSDFKVLTLMGQAQTDTVVSE